MIFSDVVKQEERLKNSGFSGVYSPWKWEGGESRYFSFFAEEKDSDLFYVTHGITIREQKEIERDVDVKRNKDSYYFNNGKEKVSSGDIFKCVSIKSLDSEEVFMETDTINDILKRSCLKYRRGQDNLAPLVFKEYGTMGIFIYTKGTGYFRINLPPIPDESYHFS